jgi:hypothetical protein
MNLFYYELKKSVARVMSPLWARPGELNRLIREQISTEE